MRKVLWAPFTEFMFLALSQHDTRQQDGLAPALLLLVMAVPHNALDLIPAGVYWCCGLVIPSLPLLFPRLTGPLILAVACCVFCYAAYLQALIDWGVQVMECFKADVTTLPLNTASPDKANKESMEYAIVALIRVFSAEADAFRAYLQAGQNSRATAGMAGLKTLSSQV